MFFIALIPSWFRSAMDSRVVDWAHGDLSKIQIEDGKHALYERKFGTVGTDAKPGLVAAE
jgi:alkane 1-monooxygenase